MARPIQNSERPTSFSDKMKLNGERKMQQFTRTASDLEHEIEVYWHQAEGYMKKNPVKSTIIAGVVGLFLGKLLSK